MLAAVLLLIAIFSDSSASTTKATLLEHWKSVDEQRKKVDQSIGFEKSTAAAERYKAAKESLNRAEQILMQSYGDNLHAELWTPWIVVGVILICLVGVLLMTPLLSHLTFTSGGVNAGISDSTVQISNRLENLEQDQTRLRFMLAGIFIGFLGIAANIGLSMWKTKNVARRRIHEHFDDFENSLKAELLAKLEPAERSIRNSSSVCAELSRQIDAVHESLVRRHEAVTQAFAAAANDELRTLNVLVTQKRPNMGEDEEGAKA